ncbi:MAG: 16S rRNA (cytidine(1402)-2'-O)-methyltransferase [Candidatus Uhrbacteria bacterium]|nr:16S rRNA (cytidine(1402)-2'-O)-methyltransferase [Candidatus Uhrbacteria bacterium]
MENGVLYIVATPIGNVEDLSPRAKRTLDEVDLVLCEDTRVSSKLFSKLGINTPRESFHQHTEREKLSRFVDRLLSGENMALVSDAGTPTISDPGGKLVAEAAASNIKVVPIPGPSALITALSASGFPSDEFTFLGFAPNKKGRNKFFANLALIERTIAIYESKHRIIKTLEALPQDRRIVVARELTKMHETIYRGLPADVIKQIESTSAKGEFVIILAPISHELKAIS